MANNCEQVEALEIGKNECLLVFSADINRNFQKILYGKIHGEEGSQKILANK